MAYAKKDEEDRSIIKVDRSLAFQEARIFNTSPIQPRRCRVLLTKLALLLFTGERFPTNEATSLFFGMSQLFQSKEPSLRQMMYVVIKELVNSAEDVFVMTSSIMKDVAVTSDILYKANAIRTLCRIIDASTVQGIERLIKTAIVDKNPSVASAALVSSYHLLPIARDVVKRWQSETAEAASTTKSNSAFNITLSRSEAYNNFQAINSSNMTQYHAIGLLYQMRSHDRMALVKMVQQFGAPGVVKSSLALVLLVRLAAQLADEDPNLRSPMIQLIDGWLTHKSEMVNFEAAKAICEMHDAPSSVVNNAIHTLQLFLTAPRAVTKFAAIRILHDFASHKPAAVHSCNPEIEALIVNSNRSIATFAITTLLKTGNEASVDRLMKPIQSMMSEIPDEFKVTIIEAIRTLCLKFPSKQAGMLVFLSGILRDEGGYEFKRAVVESMFDLIKFVPESKERALEHLCEFIEDCEFTKLAVRILHLLGLEGPKTPQPTKYIRYIYNRVVLENAIVRAAAVTALSKFGVGQKDPEVKRSVMVLLTRCLDDIDDEVRDRAALSLALMRDDDEVAERFINNESMYALADFERQLVKYVGSDDKSNFTTPFDISIIPIISKEQALAQDRKEKLTVTTPTLKAPRIESIQGVLSKSMKTPDTHQYSNALSKIPEIQAHGPLLKSSARVDLTESEMEYIVSCVKHVFRDHVVLQYDIQNTLRSAILFDVSLLATPEEADVDQPSLVEDFIIPVSQLKADEPGTIYVSFRKSSLYPLATFTNVLKFTNKELDPDTGEPEETGYDDEYEIEGLELNGSDYVLAEFGSGFDGLWKGLKDGGEAQATTQLEGVKSIADATEQLLKALSLYPLEGSDVPVSTSTHTLKLYGKTVTGGKLVAQVRMAYSAKSGVTALLSVRSEEDSVAEMMVNSVIG